MVSGILIPYELLPLDPHGPLGRGVQSALAGYLAATCIVALFGAHPKEIGMSPNFTVILIISVLFAVPVLGFIWWRFGGSDAFAFIIVSGGFTAVMDFISSFVPSTYQTQ